MLCNKNSFCLHRHVLRISIHNPSVGFILSQLATIAVASVTINIQLFMCVTLQETTATIRIV